MTDTADVIDTLAGIAQGSPLAAIRDRRQQARENAQKSYLALFAPRDPAGVTLAERFAVGYFVVGLHRDQTVAEFYGKALVSHASPELLDAVADEIRRGETTGPYGHYPDGPLSREDAPGIVHRVVDGNRKVLGPRLSAALGHAHLLVFRPRDASAAALQALLDAGWSTSDVVTLSQLVAFLAFQIRVVTGFRALASNLAITDGYASFPLSPVAAE